MNPPTPPETSSSASRELPMVTVIMPVRNEARDIASSLSAVLAQDYPADRMEVFVADGRSTDGTPDLVRSMAKERPAVRLVDNPGQIVATGLNAGIRAARGTVIARVDGHAAVAPDYVRLFVDALERTGADGVVSRMDAFGDSPAGRAVALATSSPFGVGGAQFHYSTREQWVDTGFLGAWRRDVFERFGLFDEELVRNQDDEFNYRIRKGGGRILLPAGVSVRYRCRSSLAALGRQYFQYGYWKVRVLQKHPWQMRPRQFAPPALVLALLLPLLLGAFVPRALWLAPIALGAYLIANLLACASLAGRARDGALALLPVTFAILHLSYGLGFWVGFARFWNRWDRPGTRPAAKEGMGAA